MKLQQQNIALGTMYVLKYEIVYIGVPGVYLGIIRIRVHF